jgi:crossover junction endodeoxyribonuclease RusA
MLVFEKQMEGESDMQKTHNVTVTKADANHSHYEFSLPWPAATGNHAVKHTRTGGHYKTPQAKAYEAVVAQIVAAMGLGNLLGKKPLAGPLAVSWLLSPPDRRARDLDNLRKVVADALTRAGFWEDDSNKVLVRESFEWADSTPGGEISLLVEVVQ